MAQPPAEEQVERRVFVPRVREPSRRCGWGWRRGRGWWRVWVRGFRHGLLSPLLLGALKHVVPDGLGHLLKDLGGRIGVRALDPVLPKQEAQVIGIDVEL